jgi:MFS family permease
MMSLASFIWGVASILGPSIGGFIVNYISWRWVFFMNLPLGALSFLGIYSYFKETREKRDKVSVDILGLTSLSITVLSLLTAFMLAGEGHPWLSLEITGLLTLSVGVGAAFYFIEKHAAEPVIPLSFFAVQSFRLGNAAVFFCSFAIFGLVAYSPLFIQGALGKTPVELGLAMVSLSLAWSAGALLCGQTIHRVGHKNSAIIGAFFLLLGCGMTLFFSSSTTFTACFIALGFAGLGMGFVSISTLLIVQNSVAEKDLGIATASNQFSRTLAGTIGVGISGSLASSRIAKGMEAIVSSNKNLDIPTELVDEISRNVETLFHPDVQASLPPALLASLHQLVGEGVMVVFILSMVMTSITAVFCFMLPKTSKPIS